MKLHLPNKILIAIPEILFIIEKVSSEYLNINRPYTINFRDPDYSPSSGGYHPVEIRVEADKSISYITDFSYVGEPPFYELAKCLDFDFSCQILQFYGNEFPLSSGAEIFMLWQRNFCAYWHMGVYKIEISAD